MSEAVVRVPYAVGAVRGGLPLHLETGRPMTGNRPSRLTAFSYLTAERAPLYRAILAVFMEARARFALHLRPADVAAGLGDDLCLEEGELARALAQLQEWGNLEAHQDTTEVATVEEFYRPRFLYQLTAAGEAAERAVALYESELRQKGELKVAALEDVRQHLAELLELAEQPRPDPGKVHRALSALRERFEELTRRAQAFMRSLQRSLDLVGVGVEALLRYKEALIEYLERFVRQLVTSGAQIARTLDALDERGVERLLDLAAERDLSDALEVSASDRLHAYAYWRESWRGLSGWFRREPGGGAAQAEVLRQQALRAIPALLSAVARHNDRRVTRSDRASDYEALARWFAAVDTEADAHRLWRAAFGLCPARHLRVTAETVDERGERPVPPSTSWLTAPPLQLSVRLRKTGHTRRRGAPRRVLDKSVEKAQLAARAAEEARQLELARAELATGGRVRLSELERLEAAAFELFLDLLGHALSRKLDPESSVCATSTDGALVIQLEPTGDGVIAEIHTVHGVLRGPDHWVTIRDAHAPAPQEASELPEQPSEPRPAPERPVAAARAIA